MIETRPATPQKISTILLNSLKLYKNSLIKILPMCIIYFIFLYLAHLGQSLYHTEKSLQIIIPVCLTLVVYPFIYASIIDALHRLLSKQPYHYKVSLKQAGLHFSHILFASIIYFLATFVGIALLILPGIYFLVTLCFVYAFIMLEEQSFSQALVQSFKLVRDEWRRTAAVILSSLVIYVLFSFIFSFIINLFTMAVQIVIHFLHVPGVNPGEVGKNLTTILLLLAPALLAPLPAAFMLLQYYDLKLRKAEPQE